MSNRKNSRRPKSAKRRMPLAAVIILITITVLVLVAVIGIYWLLNIFRPVLPSVDRDRIPDALTDQVTTDHQGNVDPESVRKKDFYNFLILGKDIGGLNTDVFMVASFDIANHQISLMQIPRDTYLESDGNRYKINAMYAHMRNKAKKENSDLKENELIHAGMQGLSDELGKSLNISLDYYVIMDLQGFRNIVDAIDGVYMYVPRDMYYIDEEQDLKIDLKQGWQTLNGAEAEQFVRFRKGYAMQDLTRIEAQKLFMNAFANRLKEKFSVTTVVAIAEQAFRYVNTSLKLEELIYFAKEFYSVDTQNMIMLTCPGEATYVGQGSYYVVHRAALLATLNRYFNVYIANVSDSEFDADRVFVGEEYPEVNEIYLTPYEGLDDYTHSGDDIDKDGIPLY